MRVKTQTKRDAITKAASAVFLEMGYERASMAEISARVGGSKATLYSYFPSKEALFMEISCGAARHHIDQIFMALEQQTGDLRQTLCKFGTDFLALICSESSIQVYRAVIAESGRSDIGKQFYEMGPQMGMMEIGHLLNQQMDAGTLRRADPQVAARHLLALLTSETVDPCLFGDKTMEPAFLKQATERAIDVFFRAYAA